MVTFSLYAGWSDNQCVSGLKPSDPNHTSRICFFPDTVCPGPNVAVAFGAYRPIIMSMSFFEIASWKVLSIRLIAY